VLTNDLLLTTVTPHSGPLYTKRMSTKIARVDTDHFCTTGNPHRAAG